MIYVCCGSPRSGSTLQYNLVSELIELLNLGERIGYFDVLNDNILNDINSKFNNRKIVILKTHNIEESLLLNSELYNLRFFHIYRDIRDVINSYSKKFGESIDVIIKSDFVENYIKFNDKLDLINKEFLYSVKYEDVFLEIKNELIKICEFLKLPIENQIIDKISSKFSLETINSEIKSENYFSQFNSTVIGNSRFNNISLFHTDHINSSTPFKFQLDLNPIQIKLIEEKAFNWLIKRNYKFYVVNVINQAKWAINLKDFKNSGIFIEFGAGNGIETSKTFELEKLYNWSGICFESNGFYKFLIENRKSFIINSILFKEEDFRRIDQILNHFKLKHIDFLAIKATDSLDEYEVISFLPLNLLNIDLIAVEHSYIETKRQKIYELLTKNGFIRQEIVDSKFDDWYYHERLLENTQFLIRRQEELYRKTFEIKNKEEKSVETYKSNFEEILLGKDKEIAHLKESNSNQLLEIESQKMEITQIKKSLSWRITKPLRILGTYFLDRI